MFVILKSSYIKYSEKQTNAYRTLCALMEDIQSANIYKNNFLIITLVLMKNTIK